MAAAGWPCFCRAVKERDVYSSSGVGAYLGTLGKAQFWLGANGKMAPFAWDIAMTGHNVTVIGCILVSFISLHFCMCVGVISTPRKAENHHI